MSNVLVETTVAAAVESEAPPPIAQSLNRHTFGLTRKRRTPRRHATCPDRGSLYDILRQNCGMSLFVLPILWTDAHARLLRAVFVGQDPILTPVPSTTMTTHSRLSTSCSSSSSSQHLPRPSEVAEALSYDLTSLLSPEDTRPFSKSRAIKSVLTTLFSPVFSRPKSMAELDIHFGGRVFRGAVRVPVMWKCVDAAGSSFDSAVTRPVSSFGHTASGARETNTLSGSLSAASSQDLPDNPTVAYVNRSHLSMIRQNLFRIVPGPENGDRGNTPVSRLQSLRSKQLMPSDADRDAYLMGVFIAMAQAHFYDKAPSRMASQMSWWNNRHRGDETVTVPDFHDVRLYILTHDDDASDFIVYTTVVTAAFLKRFAEPTKAPLPEPVESGTREQAESLGMRIEYTRVPVWPIFGLKERLGKALGSELVGDVHEMADLLSDGDIGDGHTETQRLPNTRRQKTRPDSLKRKRLLDRPVLAEMLSIPGEPDNSDSAGSVVLTSPTLSPRAKRRQTRSLSSSLAVY